MDFTSNANTPEALQERQFVEEMMKTRRELVQIAINEWIDKKKDVLQEIASSRSGHVSLLFRILQ